MTRPTILKAAAVVAVASLFVAALWAGRGVVAGDGVVAGAGRLPPGGGPPAPGSRVSGRGEPRWQVEQLTVASARRFGIAFNCSLLIAVVILIIPRAMFFVGLSSFSHSPSTWQCAHVTPSARVNDPIALRT